MPTANGLGMSKKHAKSPKHLSGSLRSKRFRGKFRCFGRAKVGARAKKQKRVEGERREENFLLSSPPSPLSFFFARPNFRATKTSKFATETLASQAISVEILKIMSKQTTLFS